MVIEGIKQPEALRDFLYRRMRGARNESATDEAEVVANAATEPAIGMGSGGRDQVLGVLTDIRDALREVVRQRGVRG
jgi:putative membrane protein